MHAYKYNIYTLTHGRELIILQTTTLTTWHILYRFTIITNLYMQKNILIKKPIKFL